MASPSEQVRAAIARMKGEAAAAKFSEEDLKKLTDQGYVDEDDLRSISRESLIAMGLKLARVDALVGKDSADPPEEMVQMRAAIAKLNLTVYTATRTSQTDADLGKVWRAKAKKIMDLSFLAAVKKDTLEEVAKAVLEKFPDKKGTGLVFAHVKSSKAAEDEAGPSATSNKKRKGLELPSPNLPKLPGYTLADCIPAARSPKFKEDTHMQPAVIKMIEAAVELLKAKLVVKDTHSSSHQFIHPVGRPDVSLLAAALVAWTQLVSVGEFKVGEGTDEVDSMFGQLISRARAILDSQPERQRVVSFGLTMNSIEFVHVQREQDQDWIVQTTGPLPFSISPESAGFKLLVRLLKTDISDLGFIQPEIPDVPEEFEVSNLKLLRRGELRAAQGTVPNNVGSVVFRASTPDCEDCILKLCHTSHEGDVLSYLEREEVSNIVELLDRGLCTYNDREWEMLLLAPWAERLTQALPVQTLAQVTLDIARAICQCFKAGVAHRDVTLDNIGMVEGRGYLYDFSAAKLIDPEEDDQAEFASPSGRLDNITGTALYAALSVLEGRRHTISSMLEGLYLSILAVCCDEKLTGRHDMKISNLKNKKCEITRRGIMVDPHPQDFDKVPSTHSGLVREMHELFYPLKVGSHVRDYNMGVDLDSVERVCKKWIRQ